MTIPNDLTFLNGLFDIFAVCYDFIMTLIGILDTPMNNLLGNEFTYLNIFSNVEHTVSLANIYGTEGFFHDLMSLVFDMWNDILSFLFTPILSLFGLDLKMPLYIGILLTLPIIVIITSLPKAIKEIVPFT